MSDRLKRISFQETLPGRQDLLDNCAYSLFNAPSDSAGRRTVDREVNFHSYGVHCSDLDSASKALLLVNSQEESSELVNVVAKSRQDLLPFGFAESTPQFNEELVRLTARRNRGSQCHYFITIVALSLPPWEFFRECT